VQQAVQRRLRLRPDEQDVDQIAIVQHRRGFSDAGLVAVRFGAFTHQRLGRNAPCERGALRRLLDGVGEAFNRCPHRRVLGRIECPAAHGGEHACASCSSPWASSGDSWGGGTGGL